VTDGDQFAFIADVLKKEKNPEVIVGALSCLTRLRTMTPKALKVFVDSLESPHEDVRRTANRLLLKGANEDFGFQPTESAVQRAAAIGKWREWYAATGSRLRWNSSKRRFEPPGAKTETKPASGQ